MNQGVSDVSVSVLLDADTWRAAVELEGPGPAGEYILGIDLGQNAAMSAAAAYFRSRPPARYSPSYRAWPSGAWLMVWAGCTWIWPPGVS